MMDARMKSGHDECVPSLDCQNEEAAATRFSSSRSPWPFKFLLLAVADAIDRAGPIIGNQDRTVLGQDDIGGTAEIALIALDPAGREHFLLGVLAVRTDGDAHDASALIFMPVPGAVLGDQDRVLVVGGELIAGIELHAERSDMGAEVEHRWRKLRTFVAHREFRIRQVALV